MHYLLFEEVDAEGVAGCIGGLCRSHCSYAGVIAYVLGDTSCGCPKTLVCELSYRVASMDLYDWMFDGQVCICLQKLLGS